MSKNKGRFTKEENERLHNTWYKSKEDGKPLNVRQLARIFKCNQPRILKELNYWKGIKRVVKEKLKTGPKLKSLSLEEATKQYEKSA